jgi:hypothetical protein
MVRWNPVTARMKISMASDPRPTNRFARFLIDDGDIHPRVIDLDIPKGRVARYSPAVALVAAILSLSSRRRACFRKSNSASLARTARQLGEARPAVRRPSFPSRSAQLIERGRRGLRRAQNTLPAPRFREIGLDGAASNREAPLRAGKLPPTNRRGFLKLWRLERRFARSMAWGRPRGSSKQLSR